MLGRRGRASRWFLWDRLIHQSVSSGDKSQTGEMGFLDALNAQREVGLRFWVSLRVKVASGVHVANWKTAANPDVIAAGYGVRGAPISREC